jgi:hypothetical protein
MTAPPMIAANANIKYALECGAAKSTPPDNDYSDPIFIARPRYLVPQRMPSFVQARGFVLDLTLTMKRALGILA